MQRDIDVVNIDVVIFLQFFNTPGTEIAPGSDEIGIDVEDDGIAHFLLQGGLFFSNHTATRADYQDR